METEWTHDFIRSWSEETKMKDKTKAKSVTKWKTKCGKVVDTKHVSTDPTCPDCRKQLRRN